MYPIDDNIPLPAPLRGAPQKYPYTKLEVGQSYFVPNVAQKKAGSGYVQFAKRTGRKFVSRIVDGGVRVWRVE